MGTLWDTFKYDLLEEESCMHWIFTRVLHKETGQQVSLFNLYASVLLSEKRECWDFVSCLLSSHKPENIIVARDLNVTLSPAKIKGGTPVRDPTREWVEDIMLDWGLEDIKPNKGNFTWSNKWLGSGHITTRLDSS